MRWVASIVLVSAMVFVVGCGDDDGRENGTDAGPDGGGSGGSAGSGRDAGPMSGSGGRGGSGGSGTSGTGGGVAPVMCGSETCAVDPGGAMLGVTACCTDDDACGQETPLAPGTCLPLDQPGGIDPGCPTYDVMSFTTWYGCCTPAGECGALAAGSLGCIPNSTLMAPDQSCTYDPNNTCERLFEVTCDGAEDCGSGQKCCAQYDGGYRTTVCADDCAAEEMEQGGTWSALCHPGDTCETPEGMAEYMCLQNTDFLPDYLFRCRDTGTTPEQTGSTAAGEINCGEDVCGSGEKCCISVPGLPVCVPSSQDCRCTPEGGIPDAGTDDAGQ